MIEPNKPLDILIDQFIQTDVDAWIEAKQREPEQMELVEDEP